MDDVNAALMRRARPSTAPKRKRASAAAPRREAALRSAFAPSVKLQSGPTRSPVKRPRASSSASSPATITSPSAAAATTAAAAAKLAPSVQAYIDVGQKSFGRHTTCPTCGLLYTVGEQEDEKEHRRFCRRSQKGLTVASWKNERLVRAFPEQNARIIEIRRGDAPAHVKKLLELKLLLDDALGVVDDAQFLQRSSFVFVQDKQIVGCATAERVDHAFALEDAAASSLVAAAEPVAEPPTESSSSSSPSSAGGGGSKTPARRPVLAGICQLWVHSAFRGRKIATRLVDSVRDKLIYGLRVEKRQLAFAQPTKNGLAFARSYAAPHGVLVYDTVSTRKEEEEEEADRV